jgi:hypothetical protein
MRSLISIPTMIAVMLAAGCGGGEHPTSTRDPKDFSLPLDYSSDEFWLCRPGLDENQCLVHDLAATVILPDGSTEREEHVVDEDPEYDCFYVLSPELFDGDARELSDGHRAGHGARRASR